ncbi:MAG: ABC transporter substrate-binding protein [Alphaproteobacteria bacterium]|nr:ABC transporter substrate-binding protein [Alphaproteobacteria bacterium]
MNRFLAPAIVAAGLTIGSAQAADLLVLAEDVPAGLDIDGPSIALQATETGPDNLLEPLVYYSVKGTNDEGVRIHDFDKFEGRLAQSWSYDAATRTWTFNLRRGVKGCDGATFNADDVVYTFARGKTVSGAAPIAWFLSNVASIDGFTVAQLGVGITGEGANDAEKERDRQRKLAEARKLGSEVRKIDDYTVQIRQSASNKLLLPVLTIFGLYIYDKEIMEKHATADDPWSHNYNNNVNAPSFGPYCLERWQKDQEFVVRANPDYYRGKPHFDRVILRKVPQSSNRVAILRTGQAGLIERVNPKEFDSLRNIRGVKVAGVLGNENLFAVLNFKSKPFDNVKVRQAIAHAIPYDQIIKDGYFGQASKWKGQIPESYPGFHASPTQYGTDINRAKALLAEAGYPDGRGLEAFREAFQITYPAEREATLGPIATMMRTALRGAGFPIELNPIPQTQFGDRKLVKKDLPFALVDDEKPIGVDAAYALLLYHVSAKGGGLNNMANYESAKVDELFKSALTEADNTKRNALLAEAQNILAQDINFASYCHVENPVGLLGQDQRDDLAR